MIMFDSMSFKECIYTASYKKAHKRINKLVSAPTPITSYLDYGTSYGWPNVGDTINLIFDSLDFGQPDKEYKEFMDAVDEYVGETWYMHVHGFFYFKELLENRYLFSQQEYQELEKRIHKLFYHFDSSLVMTYDEYVHDYIDDSTNELNQQADSFLTKMKHTYVIHDNPEYHCLEMYDSAFFNQLAKFVEEYYAFYKDLISEIKKRRLV